MCCYLTISNVSVEPFSMSNISSLRDLRQRQEVKQTGKEKDAKKENEFFIGGIDQRGGGSGLGCRLISI